MANISNSGWLWHARYGHLNFHSLKQLNDKRMVDGLQKITQVNQFCDGCLIGKQHATHFPRTTYRVKESLDLIHGDLCESPSSNRNSILSTTSKLSIFTITKSTKLLHVPNLSVIFLTIPRIGKPTKLMTFIFPESRCHLMFNRFA